MPYLILAFIGRRTMIEQSKYFLKCRCGANYEVLLGVLGNFVCRQCGNTQITLYSQVVQKEEKKVSKHVEAISTR
jgi:hypothetical protein